MKCLGKALRGHLRCVHVQSKPTLQPPQYYGPLVVNVFHCSNIYGRTPQGSDVSVICCFDHRRSVIMFDFFLSQDFSSDEDAVLQQVLAQSLHDN